MKQGWEIKKLGEISDFQGGSQPPKEEWISEPKNGYVRMLQIRDFTKNNSLNIEYVKKSNRLKYCKEDDILIGRYGASVGKILTGLAGAYNVAIIKTIPNETLINKSFFRHFLYAHSFQEFLQHVSKMRAAQAGFSKEDIQEYQIPVPPLSEQERIVAELDLLSDVIAKKREQLKQLDTLAQSIFYDMFGDPITNEKGWRKEKITKIAPIEPYQGDVSGINGMYWLLNLDMIQSNKCTIHEKVYVQYDEVGTSTIKFNKDNVLYSKLRPYLNKVVIPNDSGYCTSELVPFKPFENIILKIFLCYVLSHKSFVNYISSKVIGAKMPRVSMDALREFNVITPPLPLQQQFASKIEAIEKQKELIKQSLSEVQQLFDSRMDYYFG